jgi:hypothetical protein
MKLLFKIFILSPLFFFATNTFAFFCPTNFSQINIGDPMKTVIELCGRPDYQHTYIKSIYVSQELIYYVKTNPLNASTAKLSVVLNNDQIVNITITDNTKTCQPFDNSQPENNNNAVCKTTQESRSVGSTTACGSVIRIGDRVEAIQAACGQPAFINHSQQQADSQNTFTEFKYNGPPSISLIFENGLLKERVQN